MVLRENAKLGLFRYPQDVFDKDASPLDIPKPGMQTTAAPLWGWMCRDVADKRWDYVRLCQKYKMADKLKALELLGRHLGTLGAERRRPEDEAKETDPITRSLKEAQEKWDYLNKQLEFSAGRTPGGGR